MIYAHAIISSSRIKGFNTIIIIAYTSIFFNTLCKFYQRFQLKKYSIEKARLSPGYSRFIKCSNYLAISVPSSVMIASCAGLVASTISANNECLLFTSLN